MRDDPQMQDKGEIVMVIGQNDVMNSKDTGNFEFVYTIDKSVEKMKKEMERQSTKSLAILMKVDDPMNPTLSPDLARREKYLKREMGGGGGGGGWSRNGSRLPKYQLRLKRM